MSIVFPNQGRRASAANAVHSRPKLNRSLTVSGESGNGFHASQQPHNEWFPLKKFSKAKQDMSHNFDLLHARLVDSQRFVSQLHTKEMSNCEDDPIKSLIAQTEGNLQLVKRDQMKIAFFGRTSNGKSTVINSLMRAKVLPSGMGHITNCFCSVVGVDESEGYLCTPDSEEKQNVKNVRQLAHSLHKERLDPNSMVQIFWPKSKCPLLSEEIELVDSPGIDMSPDFDQWIESYCLDADVFVLVSNAESALMTAEKNFFHRVSERLSKPNIFILNNMWDRSAQEEPDMCEEVMKQHLHTDIDFLSKELSVVDEQTARERVFFVSAREVLQIRTRIQPGTVVEEEGYGLADGWKVRLMAFEKFEESVKQCISSTAILTKFLRHYRKGLSIVDELEKILSQEVQQLDNQSERLLNERQELMQRSDMLKSNGQKLSQSCPKQVEVTVNALEQKMQVAVTEMEKKLPGLVRGFKDSEYTLEQTAVFQQSLCEHLDKQMSQDMEYLCANTLAREYEQTKNKLITSYRSLLALPAENMQYFHQLIGLPYFSLAFNCADLCQDFTPDTQFNFLNSIGFRRLKKTFNLESVLGGAFAQGNLAMSLLPMEYAIPISILGCAVMLPRLISWRVWLVSLAAYLGLYTWKWSTFIPKTAYQDQFVSHFNAKLRSHASISCKGYRDQVEGSLRLLIKTLQGELKKEEQSTHEISSGKNAMVTRCSNLQHAAKGLRNNVHLLKYDFEKFKEEHLLDC